MLEKFTLDQKVKFSYSSFTVTTSKGFNPIMHLTVKTNYNSENCKM